MFMMPKYMSFKDGTLKRREMTKFYKQAAKTMGDFYNDMTESGANRAVMDPDKLIPGGHWL